VKGSSGNYISAAGFDRYRSEAKSRPGLPGDTVIAFVGGVLQHPLRVCRGVDVVTNIRLAKFIYGFVWLLITLTVAILLTMPFLFGWYTEMTGMLPGRIRNGIAVVYKRIMTAIGSV
jgi:hypothetical protein